MTQACPVAAFPAPEALSRRGPARVRGFCEPRGEGPGAGAQGGGAGAPSPSDRTTRNAMRLPAQGLHAGRRRHARAPARL